MTPGSTVIRGLGRSMSRMRFMRARPMTMPTFGGERAAAEAGAGAARDEGDVCFAQMRTIACTCSAVRGQDDGAGRDAEVGEAVALVGLELAGRGDEAGLRDAAFAVA